MSRTGTSLLYQLLFGHPDIFFPPYRIQIACSSPLGFPLKASLENTSTFNSIIEKKTTIPIDINKLTDWSNINIKYVSDILDEKGYDSETGNLIVSVDPRYFRPTEVETLLGDPSKAKEKLGWEPKITLEEMVHEMMENDINIAKRDDLVKENGFKTLNFHE